KVKNKPTVNKVLGKGVLFEEYRKKIDSLQSEINQLKAQDMLTELENLRGENSRLNDRLVKQQNLEAQIEKYRKAFVSSKRKTQYQIKRRQTWCPNYSLNSSSPVLPLDLDFDLDITDMDFQESPLKSGKKRKSPIEKFPVKAQKR